jgi:hypothetical protein
MVSLVNATHSTANRTAIQHYAHLAGLNSHSSYVESLRREINCWIENGVYTHEGSVSGSVDGCAVKVDVACAYVSFRETAASPAEARALLIRLLAVAEQVAAFNKAVA